MRYGTAAAFRIALEERLRTRSRDTGESIERLRKLVAFDRLLARLVAVAPERWLLKGGLALDYRLGDRARTTKDVDLQRQDGEAAANADFRAAEQDDLGDHFTFAVQRTELLDEADVAGAVRYRVRCSLADRRFEEFLVDIGFADPAVPVPDYLAGPDLLAFAGVSAARVPTCRSRGTLPRRSMPTPARTAVRGSVARASRIWSTWCLSPPHHRCWQVTCA
jgi:hypothetical protein